MACGLAFTMRAVAWLDLSLSFAQVAMHLSIPAPVGSRPAWLCALLPAPAKERRALAFRDARSACAGARVRHDWLQWAASMLRACGCHRLPLPSRLQSLGHAGRSHSMRWCDGEVPGRQRPQARRTHRPCLRDGYATDRCQRRDQRGFRSEGCGQTPRHFVSRLSSARAPNCVAPDSAPSSIHDLASVTSATRTVALASN